MDVARIHLTAAELEQGLEEVLASPKDQGLVQAIFVRPGKSERRQLTTAKLSPEGGVEGDRWAHDHWQKLPDGRPDPRSQVSLMNARILRLVAGEEDAMSLSGDNLILELDLSEENVPAGCRVRIGDDVVLEFTSETHTGCGKFSRRFGPLALEFVNGPQGGPLNLRGRFARVVEGGTIQTGDPVAKL